MVKHVGVVIICTNCYFLLGMRFIKKFHNFYKGEYHITYCIFTDTDPTPYLKGIDNFKYFETKHDSWVSATNSKFSSILKLRTLQNPFDYVYYFDADTDITKNFDDWFIGHTVAGEHFSSAEMILKDDLQYEQNQKSLAFVPKNSTLTKRYFLGAFFGGKTPKIYKICRLLLNNLTKDKFNNIYTRWDDESYINHYFHYNPPSKLILYKDFPFCTSCKGGLENTRDSKKKVDDQKRILLLRPESIFEIIKGEVVFK
jgi:hypothetical protein